MVEQDIRVSNWSEAFKSLSSHFFFFDLEQSNLGISDKFGMIIPFLATFVLEVSAQVSLKVATKKIWINITNKGNKNKFDKWTKS